jgi:hypothetical protein
MGGRHELCLICGLCPGGGPITFLGNLDDVLYDIIKDIQEQDLDLGLNESELREEIRNLLAMFDVDDMSEPTAYEEAIKEGTIAPGPWFPFTYEAWDGWGSIAIGVFDEKDRVNPTRGYVSTIQTPLYLLTR